MSAIIKRFNPDTADLATLRKAYWSLFERHVDGRDDRHLGWWITHNAASVTITTLAGDTITAPGAEALAAIKQYETEQRKHDTWRAA